MEGETSVSDKGRKLISMVTRGKNLESRSCRKDVRSSLTHSRVIGIGISVTSRTCPDTPPPQAHAYRDGVGRRVNGLTDVMTAK